MLRMSPAEEGPRLRVFNLHPVSARWISRYDLGARVWLRSGDLCEAVTSPCEVVEHTHDVVRAPKENAMAEHATPATCGVDHVGLSVRDLESTRRFFCDCLGWRVVGERPEYPASFVSDGQQIVTLWRGRGTAPTRLVQPPAHRGRPS